MSPDFSCIMLIPCSQSLEARGNTALTTACGVLSAVFIVLGLVPQYIEVYRYKAGGWKGSCV